MEHTYDFTTGKFQFTPLREGRRGLKIRLQSLKSFNSRPCVRGDTVCNDKLLRAVEFQFTPLREGRHQR